MAKRLYHIELFYHAMARKATKIKLPCQNIPSAGNKKTGPGRTNVRPGPVVDVL
jgi:hypothetical protein